MNAFDDGDDLGSTIGFSDCGETRDDFEEVAECVFCSQVELHRWVIGCTRSCASFSLGRKEGRGITQPRSRMFQLLYFFTLTDTEQCGFGCNDESSFKSWLISSFAVFKNSQILSPLFLPYLDCRVCVCHAFEFWIFEGRQGKRNGGRCSQRNDRFSSRNEREKWADSEVMGAGTVNPYHWILQFQSNKMHQLRSFRPSKRDF